MIQVLIAEVNLTNNEEFGVELGLAAFYEALRKQGFTQAEIDLMSKTNPARVLGLQ